MLQPSVEIRGVAKNIPGIGVDDLVEVVKAIVPHYDLDSRSLIPSYKAILPRPAKILKYFTGEATKLAEKECKGI